MDDCEWEDTSDFLFRQLKTIPRELRDLIYGFVVTESIDILITPDDNSGHQRTGMSQSISIKPALLSVCHQVRYEAMKVYLSANTFRAIIYDDHSSMAPFQWILKLSDRETKSLGRMIVEFRLCEETKRQIDTALESYKNAFRAHFIANAATIDPAFQLQITQQLQAELQNIVKVDILNLISAEMRTIHNSGRFDLSRITFEGVDTTECIQVCNIWRDLLDQCVKATQNGKHIHFESAHTSVATV